MQYKGSAYHGWQRQPNALTVQEVIETVLSTLLGKTIQVVGAGRTDTGVHALFYCAHFDTEVENLENNGQFLYRINALLPADIAVVDIKRVSNDFHARFSATSRTYVYYISSLKSPFYSDYVWYFNRSLDVEAMNCACNILKETIDFTSFCKLHSDTENNNCKVMEAYWEKNNEILLFTIKANRFLRNMVRAIVGTTVDVGLHKLSIDEFRAVIAAKNRCKAGQSVPAKALFLSNIEYERDFFV